jgi:hypothetical protein
LLSYDELRKADLAPFHSLSGTRPSPEFTIRAFYVEHGREDIWWAGSFQKNGKVFVTDAERKASLKSTDVLLGIDPAWFISDDVSERPVTTPSPPPSEGSPSPTDSKFSSAHGTDIVVLSGHLQFPVETAYWARIFPVGLVNCLGLIRRNVWWLEPNTYLGSDKPTVFFLFERSDRMFVLLIPLTMNGVSAAILPQKDASVGVQITLEHNNDGQARIFVMVGSGQPHMLVERAMVQIRRLLRKSSLGTVPMPVANVVRQPVDRLAPMWYDRLGWVLEMDLGLWIAGFRFLTLFDLQDVHLEHVLQEPNPRRNQPRSGYHGPSTEDARGISHFGRRVAEDDPAGAAHIAGTGSGQV